ncbi:MAG: Protein CysO [Candidatus Woesearchaeota archaeon]|nr:Protein CysO [Candidatus Woesearchaeota archaeon]
MTNEVYENIEDLISNPENPTPLLKLGRINQQPYFELYLKLERYNPLGSIKDRIAIEMLRGAQVNEGQKIIEASSGNTGIALVAFGNLLGIPVEIAVPEAIPEEKKLLLELMGVQELWEASDDLCPAYPGEGARGLVKGIVSSPAYEGRYVNLNQYKNKLNVKAHYENTGPEIWLQTQGEITSFFGGFGTGGTLTGVGKYLKEQNPSVEIIGVEPEDQQHNLPGMKKISDLDPDLVPDIMDISLIDKVVPVSDEDAYQTAIRVARTEGALVGPTTGAILYAALESDIEGVAVVISPDDALKYVSFYKKYLEG